MRESMVSRLRAMGAMEVVEAASIAEAQARARTGPMDLAVLDLGLPDGSGLDLLAYLRSHGWPRLVVLSAADDPYSVRAAFVAGAHGYLLKNASPVVVADGVRRVLSGGVYADPSVAPLLASGLRGTGASEGLASELSGREIEVLRADREEPPGAHRPQAGHRRPRGDGGPGDAGRRHPLTCLPLTRPRSGTAPGGMRTPYRDPL
jgi:DNA-binding NarL/FixJ family response regulator